MVIRILFFEIQHVQIHVVLTGSAVPYFKVTLNTHVQKNYFELNVFIFFSHTFFHKFNIYTYLDQKKLSFVRLR